MTGEQNIKEFVVTGGALKKPSGRRGGTRKNRKQDGGDNSGALMQVASIPQMPGPMNTQKFASEFQGAVHQALGQFGPDSKALQAGGKKQNGGDGIAGTIQLSANRGGPPTLPGSPEPTPVISGIDPSQPAPVKSGGSRIVLAEPKRKTRIALKAKKNMKGGECATGSCLVGGAHTKKARKIHIRVKGVTSRLAKAKKAKKQAMAASISEIRSKLEAARVIKKGSKAPDAMLRNMYADLLITKKGL